MKRLDARGCNVTCVLMAGANADEARVFCSAVYVADGVAVRLRAIVHGAMFDAVILDGALESMSEPRDVLAQTHGVLRSDGVLVATISSPDNIRDTLTQAGYRLEHLEHIEDVSSHAARFVLLAVPRENAEPKILPIERAAALLDLRSELDAERAARKELQVALREAEESAVALERRVDEIASRREQMQAASDERAEQAAEQAYELQALLDESGQALTAARSEVARAEDAWFVLYAELEQTRVRAAEFEQQLTLLREEAQEQRDRAQRMTAAEEAVNRWAVGLQREVSDLNAKISKQSEYVADLQEQIEAKQAQIDEGAGYARRVEAELESVRRASIADKLVMNDYVESLRQQAAELTTIRATQGELAAQVEEAVVGLQAESAHLVTLIDTVQSSHFWRLKRWLGRLRARLLRR